MRSNRPKGGWACPRRAPGRTPLRPTGTSPQGCARAAGGTGSSRARVGSQSRVPPGLAAERERGDARRDGPLAHAHRDGAAGLGVLPPHEPERDRPPEAERPGRARHPSDGGVISEDVGAVRWHHVALEHEAGEPPVYVAAVADAHHDFLPRVASLGIGHEALVRDLGKQRALVHVMAKERRARLDPERLVRGDADRPGTSADERVPHPRALRRPPPDPPPRAAWLAPARREPGGARGEPSGGVPTTPPR